MKTLKSIEELTDAFGRLPGIGPKSAEKLAYAVIEMDDEVVESFINALKNAKENVHHCKICGIYSEEDECEICKDNERDNSKLIVVSNPKDVLTFEKLGTYKGKYHVLGGDLSAIGGVGLNNLRINELLERVNNDGIKEIILATNPTVEGETTALYIAKLLESADVSITRLAYGLPMGGHLEYADSLTLMKALEGRKNIK